MDTSNTERRLAAIIVMDVVGYSRLMEADERGTLRAIKAVRAELIDSSVAAHRGRVVKTTGDGFLLEFASVVDAIACAIGIQRGMAKRNADVPDGRQVVFRIGVNIGDILIDGGDIFGDGVNVAARLETLCEPGGLCISRAANEQIRDKLSLTFADLGEHVVKNISRAVGVYGLSAKDIAALPEAAIAGPRSARAPAKGVWRRWPAVAGVTVLVVAAGVAAWWFTDEGVPAGFERQLAESINNAVPAAPEQYRMDAAAAFLKSSGHRSMSIAPQAQRVWRTSRWPSKELAEEKGLEKCQVFFGEPCAVLVLNSTVVRTPGRPGPQTIRDMPRVRYTGLYEPDRIPALRSADIERPDVAGYRAATGPKAVAIHAAGVIAAVTGAASQRIAEEQALRKCNDEPARREAGGPCLLYAADNRVVLPLRATGPLATGAPAIVPPAPPSAVKPSVEEKALPKPAAKPDSPESLAETAVVAALASVLPSLTETSRSVEARSFLRSREHRAMAAYPPANLWWTSGWGSAALAEERALEGCQVRFGEPCILVAVDDAPRSAGPDGTWPRRAMARVAYDGLYDVRRLPIVGDQTRQRIDVAGYRAQQGPKAAALHPGGRLFIAVNADTLWSAETKALSDCNSDAQRAARAGPCFLYASGDQVVLPRRATAPVSAAP